MIAAVPVSKKTWQLCLRNQGMSLPSMSIAEGAFGLQNTPIFFILLPPIVLLNSMRLN